MNDEDKFWLRMNDLFLLLGVSPPDNGTIFKECLLAVEAAIDKVKVLSGFESE